MKLSTKEKQLIRRLQGEINQETAVFQKYLDKLSQ